MTRAARYADDLAYIHDVSNDFVANVAPGLLELFGSAGLGGGHVMDLGCGGGQWAQQLMKQGYSVTGVDLSPAFLRLARRRAPKARFQRGSAWTVPIPPCAAVTALGEVLNYRFDGTRSDVALGRLFRRIFRALEPGGLFVFDVAEPGRHAGVSGIHRSGADWAYQVSFEQDTEREQLTRQIVSFRRRGQNYRRSEETHRLALLRGSHVLGLLRGAGFRARSVRRFGETSLPHGLVGLIARKP